ncbi:MAG: type transport system ATP-binding protein, partial [Pseudonocardiales bacterium]|nr:type transport system ATP-binding protein [Pseudonocardiales bacterium]
MTFLRRVRDAPRRLVAAVVVVLLAALAVTIAAVSSSSPAISTHAKFIAGTPEAGRPVQLDTTLYLPEKTPAPAVLLAHGFGSSKDGVASQARALARHGYVV